MNSATANFQLKTILRNDETGGHLVYHKQDQHFYSASSLSKLNQNEYETNFQDVGLRIQQFINDNQTFLDRKILLQFSTRLESRICKMKTRTGILGIIGRLFSLFYYAFNKQSKIQQNQQQQSLESIQNVVNNVLSIKVDEEDVVVIDDKKNHHNPAVSTPLRNTLSSAANELPPLKSPLQVRTPQPVKVHTPQPAANLPASLRTPLRNTPVAPTGNIPAPPLTPLAVPPVAPPLTPSFVSSFIQFIRRSPAKAPVPLEPAAPTNILLPNEPLPPTFNGSNYGNLSIETLEQQIKDIEAYVQQVKTMLAPLQKIAHEYDELQKSIKENNLRLSNFRKYKKQCEDVQKYLETGKKQGFVVLSHKTSPSSEIPFYSDGLPQQFSVDPSKIPSSLKISQAILIYDGLIKYFNQFIETTIPAQQAQFNQECGILRETCQKEHRLDLEDIIPLVKDKIEQIEKWQRYKIARENERTKKLNVIRLQTTENTPSNNRPAIQGMRFSLPSSFTARLNMSGAQKVTDEFNEDEATEKASTPAKHPILDMIKRLPENIHLILKRSSIAGTEAENIARNFETSFYGQLSVPASRKKVCVPKESAEGKEELGSSEHS